MITKTAAPGQKWRLRLRAEQLRIVKTWQKTGEFKIYKKTDVRKKIMVVPVQRETLVIEWKAPAGKKSGRRTEVCRIPIREERAEIIKHPVTLAYVSIRRHRYQRVKRIGTTLKKEEVRLETSPSRSSQ